MNPRPKTESCPRRTTSWPRFASWRTTEIVADARRLSLWLSLLVLAAQSATAGYTAYGIDDRELAEKQSYGIQAAHFAGSVRESAEHAFDLQLWVGDEGGSSDIFGAGIGLSYDHRISDRWSAGLSGGSMGSTVGSWWIGAQGAGHFQAPGGWMATAQIAVAHQDAGGDYALSCEGAFGGYAQLPVGSLRYLHVYEHLLLSKRTGIVRWLVDLGHLDSFVNLREGGSAFVLAGECVDKPVDSVHQLSLGGGLGIRLGSVEVITGIHKGSLSLQFDVQR